MDISIIVAMARNRVIGCKGSLPWHLPADLEYFCSKTTGHIVVMGRKTFESIGKPLPKRINVILSRRSDFVVNGCVVFCSIKEALKYAEIIGEKEVFIAGGEDIYKQTLSLATKLYITLIDKDFVGDSFFPKINQKKWQQLECISFEPDDKNPFGFSFFVYSKNKKEVCKYD